MNKRFIASFLFAGTLLTPLCASAAPVKAFISAFNVTPQEAAPLKDALQRLLCSRLGGDDITLVDSASEAQVVVNGSYTRIGKTFSLDAVAKRAANGETVVSAYAQGQTEDDLIPALGTVSSKLKSVISKTQFQDATPPAAQAPIAQPNAAAAVPAQPVMPAPAIAVAAAPRAAEQAPLITKEGEQKPQQGAQPGSTLWISQRISGALASIAPAGTAGGARLLIVANSNKVKVYRQEKNPTQLAEVSIPLREKVVAVDSVGSESEGTLRVYVTSIDGDAPASRVYSFEKGKLKLVAENLPYMFRALALNGGATKIYAQEMGRVDDFYGDVYEATEKGGKIELKNPIKMPRFANVFNFNKFTDADKKSYLTAFSSDGYLIVYSENGDELWRSQDKMGGSETYFTRADAPTGRLGDESVRWRFIDQRITVTDKGEIIVPQNDGLFVIGNQHSYKKYSFSCFTWNGSSLEERWKTKVTPNYLADYFYVPGTHELVLLEVVQKEGPFSKGGSAVRVVRAD